MAGLEGTLSIVQVSVCYRENNKQCQGEVHQFSDRSLGASDDGIVIGASLSEPHTSVIALRVACVCTCVCTCVCMFVCVWPYTGNLN